MAEAAERLGITKEAVRKRISRGTLRADKDRDGTVRVYVPASTTESDTASAGFAFDRDELISELRARIDDLRTDRDAWRDQARRSDYMASAALERTRELEDRLRELEAPASPDTPESSESRSGAPTPAGTGAEPQAGARRPETQRPSEAAQPRPDAPGPQQGARRPWWRRVFGG